MPNEDKRREMCINEICELIRLTDLDPEGCMRLKERLKKMSLTALEEILDTEVVQTAVKIAEARRRVYARLPENPMMSAKPRTIWAD